jgi:hypothetical protein
MFRLILLAWWGLTAITKAQAQISPPSAISIVTNGFIDPLLTSEASDTVEYDPLELHVHELEGATDYAHIKWLDIINSTDSMNYTFTWQTVQFDGHPSSSKGDGISFWFFITDSG